MRGDVGASCMVARDMKTKLKYIKYAMNSDNKLLNTVCQKMFRKDCDPICKTIKNYMESLKIRNIYELNHMTDLELMDCINRLDSEQWLEELENKKTLSIYKKYKTKIQEETIYDNSFGSKLLFRARSNSLELFWRNVFSGGDVSCKLCNRDVNESLEHFIGECEGLVGIRNSYGVNGAKIEEILQFNGNIDVSISKQFLTAAWGARQSIIKN